VTSPSHIRPRLAALLLVASLLAGLGPAVAVAPSAGAAPPTTDPATAAGYGARWLAAQVTPGGYIAGHGGVPDASDTVLAALSLAASGHDQATFDSMVSWLAANVDTVTGTGTDVDPGSTGYLLLVVAAAHGDATDFGGVDLVARLGATLGAFEPGLYGSYATVGDPTYSGVYDQSLALLGLQAVGGSPAGAAVDWLAAQQCGGSAEFDGAWMSYRAPKVPADPADPLTPCTAFDSSTFTGIDTNSTALAYEALRAVGRTPAHDALAWLARTQNSDGSFGFYVGNDGDPNSTGLVIQAIVAAGQSPTDPTWAKGADTPLSALSSFQLGCDAAAADQGAFTFPGSGGGPSLLATEQAVWGEAQTAFPLGPVSFTDAPAPCQPTTTTTAAASGTPTTVAAVLAAAAPVDAAPAFTG
jgi:hypothetical protein